MEFFKLKTFRHSFLIPLNFFPQLSFYFLILFLSGCATGGPITYGSTKVDPIQFNSTNSYVYFYRSCTIWGIGRGVYIFDNEQQIGGLNCNSYFIYETTPGEHKFYPNDWIRKEESLMLNLEPGQKYYVKTGVEFGLRDVAPYVNLTNDVSDAELSKLKQVPLLENTKGLK